MSNSPPPSGSTKTNGGDKLINLQGLKEGRKSLPMAGMVDEVDQMTAPGGGVGAGCEREKTFISHFRTCPGQYNIYT